MSSKDGVGQTIKTFVTVVTFIALTRWFRVIKATLNNLLIFPFREFSQDRRGFAPNSS